MTEQESFLEKIADNPEDDTNRLVYADYLDEQEPVLVTCPQAGYHQEEYHYLCAKCRGVGTVLDTSNADLAAFIRVQCGPPCQCDKCRNWGSASREGCLVEREDDLLTRYRDKWLACPCRGRELMRRVVQTEPTPIAFSEFRPHLFRRGFLDEVTLPITGAGGAFDEASANCNQCGGFGEFTRNGGIVRDGSEGHHRCPTCNRTGQRRRWQPTKLALGIVSAFPTITRLRMSDRSVGGAACSWLKDPDLNETYSLPNEVFEGVYKLRRHTQRDGLWLYFRTDDNANDTLAVAALNLVKKEIGK